MKTPLRALFPVTILLAGALALTAHPATSPASADSPLEKIMNGMKGNMRALMSGIADPAKNEQSIEALGELERLTLEAKKLEPSNLKEVEAEKRDEHTAQFRADLSRLLIDLAQAEISVLEGDNAAAESMMKNTVVPLRNDAHDKYQPEDGKKKR